MMMMLYSSDKWWAMKDKQFLDILELTHWLRRKITLLTVNTKTTEIFT